MRAAGLDVHGLVGLNFLKAYLVTLDFPKRTLRLDASAERADGGPERPSAGVFCPLIQPPRVEYLQSGGSASNLMLWCFERHNELLRVETRYDNETSEFVAIVRHPDGREETHRFATADAFRSWLTAFEQTLAAEQWTSQGPPLFLPEGWPDERKM